MCGYDTRRAGLPGIAAGSSAGTVFTKTSSIQSMYPYLRTLKKNLNAPRPSEHPPVRGKKCQNV